MSDWSAFWSGFARAFGLFPQPVRDPRSDLEVAMANIADAVQCVIDTNIPGPDVADDETETR